MKKVRIDRNRIKQLIYPTFGFPAIAKQDEHLTIEFDPRNRDWNRPLPQVIGFQVTAVASNSGNSASWVLPLKDIAVGFGARWPEHAEELAPRALIYRVTVEIPAWLPVHLYDLAVKATLKSGSRLKDAQPHALQVVDEYRTDITFAHMTDIHVWGHEATYVGSNTHERGWRHEEYSEDDGYGATYYHKAIQQMNRAKPDFIVYTGDYDFGLTWPGEQDYSEFDAYEDSPWAGRIYETWFELDWFYAETLKLEVPVFMVPGNHDGWARFDQYDGSLQEDYLASWRELFGPQYFSFDYGPDCHFAAINSMDWTPAERDLHWAIPMELLGPHKWQGQVRGGGDRFEAGWKRERENAVDEGDFTGQLRWLKKNLKAHGEAKMKMILLHHDPWKREGSGSMFEHMPVIPGLLPWGGRGTGRLALIKLARENNVSLVLSGHDHSDSYGAVEWEGGGGEVKFANTTSTQFQDGERQGRWEYPGYRFVRLKDNEVETCWYQVADDANGEAMHYSWPFYAGTTVGGPSDLESLVDPAIATAWTERPANGQGAECTITNRLTGCEITPGGSWSGDLDGAFVEVSMPYLEGGYYYTVAGGTISEVFDDKEAGNRTYCITTDVSHATGPDAPSTMTVKVARSETPDKEAPVCTSFHINGGAAATPASRVTLTNDAVDTGGSGLLQMKIWNDGDTERKAQWQRYAASTGWELRHEPGVRKVNVRFRDGSMPPNVSNVSTAKITLEGSTPTITAVTPCPARVGDPVVIDGAGFGESPTPAARVLFCDIASDIARWTDTQIECTVPYGACTGEVTVFTDLGSASSVHRIAPTVQSILPDHAYCTGPLQVEHLDGTGFAEDGGVPVVKLTDGPVDIPASNVTVVSPQSITCDFDLTGVAPGYYSVVVTNGDGSDHMLTGALVVDNRPPTLSGIEPDTGRNSGKVDVTIKGGGFLEGMRATLIKGGVEIEAGDLTVASPTCATGSFDMTGAAAGKWRVLVRNKDAKEGELPRRFMVE